MKHAVVRQLGPTVRNLIGFSGQRLFFPGHDMAVPQIMLLNETIRSCGSIASSLVLSYQISYGTNTWIFAAQDGQLDVTRLTL